MNSKYRIGFLCAGAAFFLFITLAYKMSYEYSMDRHMEKLSQRKEETENEDVQKADGIGKTESIAAEGEAVKGGAKKGFYLKELHGFVVVYLEDKKTIYEFTEIPLSDLPEEVRQEIAQGKQIATAEELYAFLENYSS